MRVVDTAKYDFKANFCMKGKFTELELKDEIIKALEGIEDENVCMLFDGNLMTEIVFRIDFKGDREDCKDLISSIIVALMPFGGIEWL